MPKSLAVIGLGRMAQVILHRLFEIGHLQPEEVIGVVGKPGSVKRVINQFPSNLLVLDSSNPMVSDAWDAPVKILAVKPQQLHSVKEERSSVLDSCERPLIISILAGITLEKLEGIFPSHACVRAVPNTPALVNAGLTGLSWGKDVSALQKQFVQKVFDPISEICELPEEQLDAFLALTSSGPGYIALIAEALADGAVAAGLPRDLANYLTYSTLEGTGLLLKQKELHPGQLKDMVASPSGTTISALRHLEKKGVRSALIEAVVLAANKSREMAKLN